MKSILIESVRQPSQPLKLDPETNNDSRPLEVNVIFTGAESTHAALQAAGELGKGLRVCIHLWAAIVVPIRVSLDAPPVSVPFFEKQLHAIVGKSTREEVEYVIHLYICRNWAGTLLQVVKPNSIVVIGGRKRWWSTESARIADALQVHGCRVAWIDTKAQPKLVRQFA